MGFFLKGIVSYSSRKDLILWRVCFVIIIIYIFIVAFTCKVTQLDTNYHNPGKGCPDSCSSDNVEKSVLEYFLWMLWKFTSWGERRDYRSPVHDISTSTPRGHAQMTLCFFLFLLPYIPPHTSVCMSVRVHGCWQFLTRWELITSTYRALEFPEIQNSLSLSLRERRKVFVDSSTWP